MRRRPSGVDRRAAARRAGRVRGAAAGARRRRCRRWSSVDGDRLTRRAAPPGPRGRRRPGGRRLPAGPGRRHRARLRHHHRRRRLGVTGADRDRQRGPGRPARRPGSARCPAPTSPRRSESSSASCPTCRTCPSCPAAGPGADMIGRGAGLLVELPVELYAGRWRVAAAPGRGPAPHPRPAGTRPGRSSTEQADGYAGPLKVQAAGPWTLAASLDLPIGGRMLRDHGAVRDLADSLAEGLRAHVAEVAPPAARARRCCCSSTSRRCRRCWPGGCRPRAGCTRCACGRRPRWRSALARSIVDAVGVPVIVHCCAPTCRIGLLRAAGASRGRARPGAARPRPRRAGRGDRRRLGLFAGAVPTTGTRPPPPPVAADAVTQLWRRLGFPLPRLPAQVVVTPACGLAGATPDYARAAADRLRGGRPPPRRARADGRRSPRS